MTAANTVLGGRYELQEIIGRGGMAEVWRARDVRLGRDIAVKRLRIDLATDPTFQARFGREAQSAAGLNHPNIVSVYDTGGQVDEATGVVVPYIVMELVGGRTLRDMLRDGRTIEPAEALGYTRGVLDALDYSHKHGIIHRDIKPANVMITPTGQVKVMDFGIARAVTDTSATMTQTAFQRGSRPRPNTVRVVMTAPGRTRGRFPPGRRRGRSGRRHDGHRAHRVGFRAPRRRPCAPAARPR